jgi:hypothetical protein
MTVIEASMKFLPPHYELSIFITVSVIV